MKRLEQVLELFISMTSLSRKGREEIQSSQLLVDEIGRICNSVNRQGRSCQRSEWKESTTVTIINYWSLLLESLRNA